MSCLRKCVAGVMVSIGAFQALDPSSILGRRKFFFIFSIFFILSIFPVFHNSLPPTSPSKKTSSKRAPASLTNPAKTNTTQPTHNSTTKQKWQKSKTGSTS